MNMHNGFEHRETPEELRPVEAALDELGTRERNSAPSRLEQGVFLASWRKVRREDSAPVIVRIRPVVWARLSVAAAVMIVGAVAAVWLSRSTPSNLTPSIGNIASTNGLEDAVNFVLDLRTSNDDLALLGDKIDTLFLDASTIGDSLKSDSSTVLLGDGAL